MQDRNLFEAVLNQELDIQDLYDTFEMVSPIIISRPKDRVVIVKNYFFNNYGIFGGVLAINSPNWSSGKTPIVILIDN